MAKIWTDDNEYADVTTIKQALWHLKVMRGRYKVLFEQPKFTTAHG